MGLLMQYDESVGGVEDASLVAFDNTGTDLTATDVEGAIKELQTKTHRLLFTKKYTDTTATWSTVLSDFYNEVKLIVSQLDDNLKAHLKLTSNVDTFSCSACSSENIVFYSIYAGTSVCTVHAMMLGTTSYRYQNTLGTTTVNNISNNAIGSAKTLTLSI